jgi:hypothetical protein
MNQEEILRRLTDLERENQRLRQQVQSGQPEKKETTTHVGMYKGRPVISFEGAFRPFTLGIRKASVVLEKITEVQHFVENNKHHLAGDDGSSGPTGLG